MRLHISDVGVRYGKITALRNVHASADGGKVIAVLGPNASGKTTLLRTIAGLFSSSVTYQSPSRYLQTMMSLAEFEPALLSCATPACHLGPMIPELVEWLDGIDSVCRDH